MLFQKNKLVKIADTRTQSYAKYGKKTEDNTKKEMGTHTRSSTAKTGHTSLKDCGSVNVVKLTVWGNKSEKLW